MNFSISITPTAIEDIENGVNYYNNISPNLGYRFTDEINRALKAVAFMPTAYVIKYKNVRSKVVKIFPYLIFYTINEANFSIIVLRIFNSYQKPFW